MTEQFAPPVVTGDEPKKCTCAEGEGCSKTVTGIYRNFRKMEVTGNNREWLRGKGGGLIDTPYEKAFWLRDNYPAFNELITKVVYAGGKRKKQLQQQLHAAVKHRFGEGCWHARRIKGEGWVLFMEVLDE